MQNSSKLVWFSHFRGKFHREFKKLHNFSRHYKQIKIRYQKYSLVHNCQFSSIQFWNNLFVELRIQIVVDRHPLTNRKRNNCCDILHTIIMKTWLSLNLLVKNVILERTVKRYLHQIIKSNGNLKLNHLYNSWNRVQIMALSTTPSVATARKSFSNDFFFRPVSVKNWCFC